MSVKIRALCVLPVVCEHTHSVQHQLACCGWAMFKECVFGDGVWAHAHNMSDLFCGAAWRRTRSRSAKSQTTLCTRACHVFLLSISLSDTCGITDCIDDERRKSSPQGDGKHDESDCKHEVESDRQTCVGSSRKVLSAMMAICILLTGSFWTRRPASDIASCSRHDHTTELERED